MPNWQALSKEKHANAGWVSPTGYPQTKHDSIAPVVVSELSHILPYYPLALAKKPDGQFQLNAMLSLESETNLYLNSASQWMVPYVPAAFRSYPFNMMPNGQGGHVLAVDVDASFFNEESNGADQRVLTEDGQPADGMKDLIKFMQQRVAQYAQTDQLVRSLVDFGLVESWPIEVRFGPSEEDVRKLLGLYRINEQALQNLDPDALSELAKSGALGLAYAQLFSTARLKELQSRYLQFKQQTQAVPEEVDLDKMFGESSDELDLFSF